MFHVIKGLFAGMAGVVAISAIIAATTLAGGGTANAQQCAKNYYSCALNKGGKLDPNNPDCCWNALGKGNFKQASSCAKGFYKCDLNAGGKLDAAHPGCCCSGSACVSDVRLKRDIAKLATLGNGISVYRFRYNWSDQVYVGVLAQQVQTIMPTAVHRGTDGYLRVNYDKVGLRFQTWEAWRGARIADRVAGAVH
jgi:hypothetical protein